MTNWGGNMWATLAISVLLLSVPIGIICPPVFLYALAVSTLCVAASYVTRVAARPNP